MQQVTFSDLKYALDDDLAESKVDDKSYIQKRNRLTMPP